MTASNSSNDDIQRLDELARTMIEKATSITSPSILSANGFAREDILILHQQRRARPGEVVGIAGGTFSGLTLAVILARVNDAIVCISAKEWSLLQRFRDKSHRHLSPVLNLRALGKDRRPTLRARPFRVEFMPTYSLEKVCS